MDYPTRDVAMIGAAGVHYVVSQLSLRGLIALPTIRNTAGVDVLVSNKEGAWHANLQIKTSRSKVGFWPVGQKWQSWTGENNVYVFLRYNRVLKGFECFLERSDEVRASVSKTVEYDKARGVKEWAPSFYLKSGIEPVDKSEQLRQQWERFGPEWQRPVVPDDQGERT
jgi:hypothetical protein